MITTARLFPILLLTPLILWADPKLHPFVARYYLQSMYMNQGIAQTELRLDETQYHITYTLEPVKWVGIINHSSHFEQASGSLNKTQVRPQNYQYQHRDWLGNLRNVSIAFKDDKIINQHLHINNKWALTRKGDELDRLSSQLQLMLDLQDPGTLANKQWHYRIADGGVIKNYYFEYLDITWIKTPIGRLQTVRLKHWRSRQQNTADQESMIVWCALKLDYLPVKVLHHNPGLLEYTSLIYDYQKE